MKRRAKWRLGPGDKHPVKVAGCHEIDDCRDCACFMDCDNAKVPQGPGLIVGSVKIPQRGVTAHKGQEGET